MYEIKREEYRPPGLLQDCHHLTQNIKILLVLFEFILDTGYTKM